MSAPHEQADKGPAIRPRVAVPLTLMLFATLLICWLVLRGTGGPFGPLRAPPLVEWSPARADEITLWAHEQGLASYQSGSFCEAAVLLARDAGGSSRQPEPLFYAGASHLMCERPALAVDLIGRAVDLRPDDAMFRYYLGWAEHARGRDSAAATQLRAAAAAEGPYAQRATRVLPKLSE